MLAALLLAQKETFVFGRFFVHFLKLPWLLFEGTSPKVICDTNVQKKKQNIFSLFSSKHYKKLNWLQRLFFISEDKENFSSLSA